MSRACPLPRSGDLMNGRIAQEGALLRRAARQSRCPLITMLRFVMLTGSSVNLTPRRPIERLMRKRGFVDQLDGISQGALRIARIGSRQRSVDGNYRAGVTLIK
jgi:hypothetical protein